MTPEEITEMQKQNTELAASLKLAEAGTGGDKMLQERNVFLEGEMKKVIESRDKAKDDKRIADEKALADQGEYKILSENQATQLTDLTKQLEGQTETLGKIKERDEATLQTRLEAITDEALRETVKNNSGTLAEKIDLAEKLATVKPAAPGARPGGDAHTQTDQEEYDQAVKDGDISKAMALKRALFSKG